MKETDLIIKDPATIEDFIDRFDSLANSLDMMVEKLESPESLAGYIALEGNTLY